MQGDIFDTIKQHGQAHLIEHYHSIKDKARQEAFLQQLKSVDYTQANQLYQSVYVERSALQENAKQEFTPITNVATHQDLKTMAEQFDKLGYEAIARGEVAVCIMSGGQGTRLGFNHPKGMFDLNLKSGLTLFGYFAHRLQRLDQLARKHSNLQKEGALIKWYLMTSEMNHNEVVTYFESNNYFGYDKNAIVFFPQGGIPAMTYEGKVVIESEDSLSLAPGGNGAIYGQMRRNKVLDHMKEHGVKYIYLGPVDNVLLKVADPTSLGYMIKHEFDIVSHYLKKRSADEKVGLHLKVNGKVKILEYSETDAKVKEQKDGQGEFVYKHGARATMYITRQFIEHLTGDPAVLASINKKYHLAEKKVKYWDAKQGKTIAPTSNTGVKFELFYFDIFEETNKLGLFETVRDEEFAPLKNATGDDSPDSARQYLKKLHRRWVEEAGIKLVGEGDVQISPRRSYNGEGLREWCEATFGKLEAQLPLYIA